MRILDLQLSWLVGNIEPRYQKKKLISPHFGFRPIGSRLGQNAGETPRAPRGFQNLAGSYGPMDVHPFIPEKISKILEDHQILPWFGVSTMLSMWWFQIASEVQRRYRSPWFVEPSTVSINKKGSEGWDGPNFRDFKNFKKLHYHHYLWWKDVFPRCWQNLWSNQWDQWENGATGQPSGPSGPSQQVPTVFGDGSWQSSHSVAHPEPSDCFFERSTI